MFATVLMVAALGQSAQSQMATHDWRQVTLTVDGTRRTAWVATPKQARAGMPLVFVYHGMGGNGRQAATSMAILREMPEAVGVFPDGLERSNPLGDRRPLPGWQLMAGESGDRDVKFYDALKREVRKDTRIGPKQFVMGHSNGGFFTYLLWQVRGSEFAGFAPSCAFLVPPRATGPQKPFLVIGARGDELIPWAQQSGSIEALKQQFGVTGGRSEGFVTEAQGRNGVPFWTYVQPGGHTFDGRSLPVVARFFRSL